jgi:phage N-6-adenine-methyltransferase
MEIYYEARYTRTGEINIMKMNTNGKGNDGFETPPFLYEQLNNIFCFTTDAACTSKNSLCKEGFYFDRGMDGLIENWTGRRIFCNPPFSVKNKWIEKAVFEVERNGCHVCVMILPSNSMSAKIWHKHIFPKYLHQVLEGRIQFIDPETGKPAEGGNNSGTTIVYFFKNIRTRNEPLKH